jgi:hypothetical protein
MNWIISKTKKMAYHTDLSVIMKPLEDVIDNYNWIVSDLEYSSLVNGFPLNLDDEYFVLSSVQLKEILSKNFQFIWAVVLAAPKEEKVILDDNNLPYAEFNSLVWKNGNIQYPGAEIEIVCWDSSCTIVKFSNEFLSNKFKNYWEDDAISLEKFDYNKLYR